MCCSDPCSGSVAASAHKFVAMSGDAIDLLALVGGGLGVAARYDDPGMVVAKMKNDIALAAIRAKLRGTKPMLDSQMIQMRLPNLNCTRKEKWSKTRQDLPTRTKVRSYHTSP
jgi:hypothetical protein